MSRSREEEGGRGGKEGVDGGRRIRALERWTGERPTERTEEMMEKSRPSPFDTLPSLHALPPSSLALSRCRRASRTGRHAHSNRAPRARMAVGGGKRRDGAPGRAPITSATTPSPLLYHHDLLRSPPIFRRCAALSSPMTDSPHRSLLRPWINAHMCSCCALIELSADGYSV